MKERRKQEILEELENEFEALRKRYKIKATLEEIDKYLGIRDKTLMEGFVSTHLIRRIIYLGGEFFMSWFGEFNSWLFPSPMDFVHGSETKKFDEKERKVISDLFSLCMRINRKANVLGEYGETENAKFIDEIIESIKNEFWPKINPVLKKVQQIWEKE
jgi:hypothetical protein